MDIKTNLEQYLKTIDEDIKSLCLNGLALGRGNAIAVSVLQDVRKDIRQILKGEIVKRAD